MLNRENYVKCFLAGGLALGLASGLPGIGGLNICCCMWVILGGGLAGYLLVHWSSYQVSNGEGALVGMLSGVLGAVIASTLQAIQWMIMGEQQFRMAFEQAMSEAPDQMPPGFEKAVEGMMDLIANPAMLLVLSLILSILVFSVFGLAGGLIAVSIWGPRKFPPFGRPGGMYHPGYPPQGPGPSVYIPPPVPPPAVPPQSGQFPGTGPGPGQGPSGPVSPV